MEKKLIPLLESLLTKQSKGTYRIGWDVSIEVVIVQVHRFCRGTEAIRIVLSASCHVMTLLEILTEDTTMTNLCWNVPRKLHERANKKVRLA